MNEERALPCQTPGRALPPPRAVPQRHGGRVPPPDRSEAANQAVDCLLAKQIAIPAENSFGLPPLKFALGRGREVRRCPVPRLPRLAPVCPGSRAPSSVPRPVPRRTARGPLGPRRGQRRRPRRRRSPARTTAHGAAAHRPALTLGHQYWDRVRRRPTPPAPVPVGGWAAGGRVTSGCAREESVGLRRCALLGVRPEAARPRRVRLFDATCTSRSLTPPVPRPRSPRRRRLLLPSATLATATATATTLTLLSPPPAFSARRSVAARSSARTGDHAARKVTRDK